jgi:hypothetical protein
MATLLFWGIYVIGMGVGSSMGKIRVEEDSLIGHQFGIVVDILSI